MSINNITVEKHKLLLEDKTLSGVYVYSNNCSLCKNQIKKLEKIGIRVSGVVDCSEDARYYIGLGYDDMPTTVLYIEGEKKFSSTGEMFDKQLNEFKSLLLTFI